MSEAWRRIAVAAALTAPAVMWAEFLGFGLATPGYNVLLRAASELAEVGARNRELFTLGFFYLAGAVTVVLGVALPRVLPAGRFAVPAGALVVVSGAALVATGMFPMDPGSPERTAQHQSISSLSFVASALAPVAAGLALRAERPGYARVSTVLGACLVAWFAFALAAHALAPLPEGVFQRPFGIALTAWYLATAAAVRGLGHAPLSPG
jgi:hypothetical membrane protein